MDEQEQADRRLEEAMATAGARDPREPCRARLRELRTRDPGAYQEAVAHYRGTLVPSVAEGHAEPLAAWAEYGRLLAELSAPGRTVAIDGTGKAHACPSPPPTDHLILRLPKAGGRALLVWLPPRPSLAQRATYEMLVAGRQKVPG